MGDKNMDSFAESFRALNLKATSTHGVGGAIHYNGFVSSQEVNPSLSGTNKYKTYTNVLLNTIIVSAGVRYFVNLVGKASWKAVPADESPQAIEYAEFIDSVMADVESSWTRIIKKATMYRFHGFSIQEWTAKRREDGKIGLKDIESRPQNTIDRWGIDESGTVTGVVQRDPISMREIMLPRDKLVYLVDDTLSDNPEGTGLLRHVVEAATRLSRYEVLEGIGFEADLRGVPVARAPLALLLDKVNNGQLTNEQYTSLIQPLKDFLANHTKNPKLGMLLDSMTYASQDESGSPSSNKMWDMEILNVNSSSQEAVASSIDRITREIARVLNVEGLLLGGDGKGSLALSKDKSNALYLVVDSTLNEIREGFQRDIVRPLWKLNGFDEALMPQLSTEAIQFRDIEQITSALTDLANAGAPLAPNDPAINEVRELMGLSPAPEEDDLDMSLTPEEPEEADVEMEVPSIEGEENDPNSRD